MTLESNSIIVTTELSTSVKLIIAESPSLDITTDEFPSNRLIIAESPLNISIIAESNSILVLIIFPIRASTKNVNVLVNRNYK